MLISEDSELEIFQIHGIPKEITSEEILKVNDLEQVELH